MRRADRLFDIIQHLRGARAPVTAAVLAAALEVGVRTIYRDIAVLQARRVPIDGEAGVGYVLRRGFDLPPLMLDTEEAEALAVGAQLLRRTGDIRLEKAARSALSKLHAVLPQERRERLHLAGVFVSPAGTVPPGNFDLGLVRYAIHAHRKLRVEYQDGTGQQSSRTIRPVAIAYYVMATIIAGWCETRQDFRHFRIDRIISLTLMNDTWDDPHNALAAEWQALPRLPIASTMPPEP